jgi:hypothetical protein
MSVCLLIFAKLIRTVKRYRKIERLLDNLLEIIKRHFVNDDVLGGLYIGISEEHEINRGITQG